MKAIVPLVVAVLLTAAVFSGPSARADVFGSGANSFSIDFVTVGSPGNPPDSGGGGLGAVAFAYRMGKYEISEQMIAKANALGGLAITTDARGPDKPATSVSWFEAARFVNWLNTSTGSAPAYKFDASGNFELWQPSDAGYDASNLFRNKLATYFLPSADEWYKAAFYDPMSGVYWDYSTGSNSPPVAVAGGTAAGTAIYHQDFLAGPVAGMLAGGLSPFGTMAQGGNVDEWGETELDRVNDELFDYRVRRGGNWDSFYPDLSVSIVAGGFPTQSFGGTGFRVGSIVPEPTAISIICVGLFAILSLRR